jgi:hypothetical protein
MPGSSEETALPTVEVNTERLRFTVLIPLIIAEYSVVAVLPFTWATNPSRMPRRLQVL